MMTFSQFLIFILISAPSFVYAGYLYGVKKTHRAIVTTENFILQRHLDAQAIGMKGSACYTLTAPISGRFCLQQIGTGKIE